MDVVIALFTAQFVFNWIVATIVAVNWCYIFKLSLPQYSETIAGWTVYTLLMMVSMPFISLKLHSAARLPGVREETKTWEVWRLLLLSTTSAAVSTSFSGWVSLVFSNFSDLQRPGPVGFTIAFLVTGVVIFIQAAMEKYLHRLPESKNSYCGLFLNTLLASGWSSLGYFWNAVWNRFLVRMRHPPHHPPHPPPQHLPQHPKLNVGHAELSPQDPYMRLDGAFTERQPRHEPRHKFKTIQDHINGRPDASSDHPGFEGLVIKAAITVTLGLIALYFLPEAPEGRDSRFWTRRRLLLAAKMMLILLPAYAVADVGYYFGTRFVADKTGSCDFGLLVAFVYAVLLSLAVLRFAKLVGWKPRTIFQNRLLQLAFWLASYAWWYPWQEVLYRIQGYGLWTFDMADWLEDLLKLLLSLVAEVATSYLMALTFRFWLLRMGRTQSVGLFGVEESEQLGKVVGEDGTLQVLANCLGIPVEHGGKERRDAHAAPVSFEMQPTD